MTDAATPVETTTPEATPPVTDKVETPSTPPTATPATSEPEKVTLDKKAHDQLVKDAARASTAQSTADRYGNVLKRHGLLGGQGHFKTSQPVTPPSEEEAQAAGLEEDRKAERGLIALALDPAHRQVLDADPTLRDMLTKNPLAVLPIYAADALDADDAVSLVKEALVKRQADTPPANPEEKKPEETPATPPAGGVNPQDNPVNEEVEVAKKNPKTENAIAGMIGARLKVASTKK